MSDACCLPAGLLFRFSCHVSGIEPGRPGDIADSLAARGHGAAWHKYGSENRTLVSECRLCGVSEATIRLVNLSCLLPSPLHVAISELLQYPGAATSSAFTVEASFLRCILFQSGRWQWQQKVQCPCPGLRVHRNWSMLRNASALVACCSYTSGSGPYNPNPWSLNTLEHKHLKT